MTVFTFLNKCGFLASLFFLLLLFFNLQMDSFVCVFSVAAQPDPEKLMFVSKMEKCFSIFVTTDLFRSDISLIILTVFYMLHNFLAEYLMLHVTP